MLPEKTIGLFYNNKVYCLNLSIFEAGLNLHVAYIKKKGVSVKVFWKVNINNITKFENSLK